MSVLKPVITTTGVVEKKADVIKAKTSRVAQLSEMQLKKLQNMTGVEIVSDEDLDLAKSTLATNINTVKDSIIESTSDISVDTILPEGVSEFVLDNYSEVSSIVDDAKTIYDESAELQKLFDSASKVCSNMDSSSILATLLESKSLFEGLLADSLLSGNSSLVNQLLSCAMADIDTLKNAEGYIGDLVHKGDLGVLDEVLSATGTESIRDKDGFMLDFTQAANEVGEAELDAFFAKYGMNPDGTIMNDPIGDINTYDFTTIQSLGTNNVTRMTTMSQDDVDFIMNIDFGNI